MLFCKYKNIFGVPKTGAHSYRLFDIAVVDVILTMLVGLLIGYITNNYLISIIFMFMLGIIFHYLFCVNTTIGKLIFGEL
jgi:hypothetical protein